jgi:prepilin-type N-terminal cleavage/methylation domain-containing protein
LDSGLRRLRHRIAFTLIELLVVIAIIAILAAMIIPITGAVKKAKLRTRTQAELKTVENAINQYKTKHGFYPPDNPGQPNGINQLFYELSGTTNNGAIYTTLDRSASITPVDIQGAFPGKNGFMNTMQGKAGDEGIIAENFLKNGIRQDQIATVNPGGGQKVNILVGSVRWPANQPGELLPAQPTQNADSYNPFRYVSTGPTNNPTSYDLWIDIFVDGKTNRFCNWSEKYLTP